MPPPSKRAVGSSGSGGRPLPGTRSGSAPSAARHVQHVGEHRLEALGELVRRAEARGIEGEQEEALVVRAGVGRDRAGARDDAGERLDQERQRESLGAAERLQQAVPHPRLRHGPARVLEHAHLAEGGHARGEIDDEVRRPQPRDAGGQRIRREPRREPAGRRDRLLGAGVVGEREQRHAVPAGAVGVVREATAVAGVPHRDGGHAVLERTLGGEVGRERADDLPERVAAVDRERRAFVAHHLGLCRRHDRALPPALGVLHEAPETV